MAIRDEEFKKRWEWMSPDRTHNAVLVELYTWSTDDVLAKGKWKLRWETTKVNAVVSEAKWYDVTVNPVGMRVRAQREWDPHGAVWISKREDGKWSRHGLEEVPEEVWEWIIAAEQLLSMAS